MAVGLATRRIALGDICLDLNAFAGTVLLESGTLAIRCPTLDSWVQKLRSCPLFGSPGDDCPFVLDHKNRLYLYRYWSYEQTLAQAIRDRMSLDIMRVSHSMLADNLEPLFSTPAASIDTQQKLALIMPLLKRFSILSGGPGTGKTTMVARMLALLIACWPQKEPKIFLAAPTGKAAAGLKASIRNAKTSLNCNQRIKTQIPDETYTLHRLLGALSGSPYFRYNKGNRMPADILIVDEASMIDLPLMSKLMQALKDHTRIVLIGDKDQLTSVESGSVLGDICNRGAIPDYSNDFIKTVNGIYGDKLFSTDVQRHPAGELNDSIVVLKKNYRFPSEKGIGGLSRLVNDGQTKAAMEMLKHPIDSGVRWEPTDGVGMFFKKMSDEILKGYSSYLNSKDPREALQRFQGFQVICAVRNGPFGVYRLNQLTEGILHRNHFIRMDAPWYIGRPILITRNNYELKLFNGDTGIIMHDPDGTESMSYAYFANPLDELHRIMPQRLPEHETAFAMTVHKSQGSEYDTVHLILPDRDSPILSRELIYTGITRAKRQVTIWGSEPVLRSAINRKIERTSGLRHALWDV